MTRFHTLITTVVLALASASAAQTDTTFTYQGSLLDGGVPVNGAPDISVSLWDALSRGSRIAGPITFRSHPVVDGIFTLQIDFGAAAFTNADRWLEVSVNTVTLSPRQPVTRSPYALQTRGLFVDSLLKVGIGTTSPTSPLHIRNPEPVFTLQDSDSRGGAQTGYVSLRDDGGGERGWFGYGSSTNADLTVRNGIGDVVLSTSGSIRTAGGPLVVQNQGNQAPLLRFATDRSWEFRQDGVGAPTALKLLSVGGGGNKDFIVQTGGDFAFNNLAGERRTEITTNTVDAGYVGVYGPNGKINVALSSTTLNRGAVYIMDENETAKISLFVSPFSGDGHIRADVKNFAMPNPRDLNTEIVFACVEGPEVAAYMRGTATLVDGRAVVELPEYFFDVAGSQGMTVQLTPRSADSMGLAVVSQSVERFEVRELHKGTGTYEFHWEVKSVRRGYEDVKVIQPRLNVPSANEK